MRIQDVVLWPEEAFDENRFYDALYERLGLRKDGSVWVEPLKRSIDARGKRVCVRIQCALYDAGKNGRSLFLSSMATCEMHAW